MKPRVYIETSVISYLAARESRDILTLARQRWTQVWWDLLGTAYEGYASNLVLKEASDGDPAVAAKRLAFCQHLPLAPQSEESTSLATKLIATKAIPASEPEDALHIALAVVHKFDFVASWNFAHLVGATAKLRLVKHIANLGYVPPIIATPEELMEEKQWNQE